MVINQQKNGNEITVIPEGRLDTATSDEFLEYVNINFTEDIEKIILDFTDIDFVSSKGLRVLVTIYKGLKDRKMEIINANASVREVLRISGLQKVFDAK